MVYYISELITDESCKKHAGGKAREDVCEICKREQFVPLTIKCNDMERKSASSIKKLWMHIGVKKEWKELLAPLNQDDIVIFQLPVYRHTVFFSSIIKWMKKKKVKTIGLIHDLESIRMSKSESGFGYFSKFRLKKEEEQALPLFDCLIAHNSRMINYLVDTYSIPRHKLVDLMIFDYIMDESIPLVNDDEIDSCIIAGSLNRIKAPYVYKLPSHPRFQLYGLGYDGKNSNNIVYNGSFLANELPHHLHGGYGLIWDGDSIETCSGVWGNYLTINNPHKTSLYLSCGLPVIIWKRAALADFVLSNKLGFTIDSLIELDSRIKQISIQDYHSMKENVIKISNRLRTGYYEKKALLSAIKLLS